MPNSGILLTPSDLLAAIEQLGTERTFAYYTGNTNMRLTEIRKPEGPIIFRRWATDKSEDTAGKGTISRSQLSTAAYVFSRKPNHPIHFDRLYSGGGNSRSAFETLLALTPHFFMCTPQRTNPYTGEIIRSLKHIMWCPDKEHSLGEITETTYDQVISEIELEVSFSNIQITPKMLNEELDSIDAKRTHTQMQVALVEIGNALGYRTWIAKNDRPIMVGAKKLGNMDGVIPSLQDAAVLYNHQSKENALLVDCIWFSGDYNQPPIIMEIEHSTGVTSGLTRMLKLKSSIPATIAKYVVVAPDGLRSKVVSEANSAVFRKLNTLFMPYSTVRELYGLIKKYSLANVLPQNFVEPFMENVVKD